MKITYEYVKEYVESFGYKLVSTEYIKSGDRLEMICNQGHACSISWDNFKYGRRCRMCADLNKANKFKFKYEEVESYIKSLGCELLTKDYKRNSQKLDIKCSCGNIYKITYQRFRSDNRYTKCIKCREFKPKKHSYEFIKSYIEENKYTLMSESYNNTNDKLTVKCDKGHIYKVTFANFQHGKRCPYCNGRMTIEDVRVMFDKEGYILLDDSYINSAQRLNIICDKGHKTTITVRDFKDDCRCNICRSSKGERVVERYLNERNIRYKYNEPYFNDLIGLGGLPIRPDFILPEHKIWIEYDGEFHYRKMYDTDGHEKIRIHDKRKNEYAKKHGWKLIRIPYWEFENIENILNKEII